MIRRSHILLLFCFCLLVTGCTAQTPEAVPEQIVWEPVPTKEDSDAAAQDVTGQNTGAQGAPEQNAAAEITTEQKHIEQSYIEMDPAAYRVLLQDLVIAYEQPSEEALRRIDEDVAAIPDALAGEIADCWKRYYLDPDYRLFCYGKDDVSQLPVPDGKTHAFVVLGYELKFGELSPELKGRCDAAALAAEAFPDALLICTGGVTGRNNPEQYTEAGRMKEYLTEVCGIPEERILTEEDAINTAENALNVYAILQTQGIKTFTIVTSSYHQQWAQVLYESVRLLEESRQGDLARMIGNYCFVTEPEYRAYREGQRYAARQLAAILMLPEEEIALLPEILY